MELVSTMREDMRASFARVEGKLELLLHENFPSSEEAPTSSRSMPGRLILPAKDQAAEPSLTPPPQSEVDSGELGADRLAQGNPTGDVAAPKEAPPLLPAWSIMCNIKPPWTPKSNSFEDLTTGEPSEPSPPSEQISPQGEKSRAFRVRRSCSTQTLAEFMRLRQLRARTHFHANVWNFLEDPESSRAALWFSRTWDPFIVVTVAITTMQSVRPSPLSGGMGATMLETAFDVAFTLEVLLRFMVSSSTCRFLKNPYNIVDMLASVPPMILRVIFCLVPPVPLGHSSDPGLSTLAHDVLLCIVPVLRVLKTLRRFQKFHLFVTLLRTILEALRVLLFTLFILVLTFSALIYLVEPRDNIESLPQAVWLTIVTVSTVGYGDVTPTGTAGHVVVAALVLCSVLYMAMPIGIIGNAFTQIWQDRDRILLMLRTRDRLVQWGYAAGDLIHLFRHFDVDQDGDLSINEFGTMITEMNIGLSGERIAELFDSIDKDGSGGIDAKELVHSLFPHAYYEIYGKKEIKVEEHKRGGHSPDYRRRPSNAANVNVEDFEDRSRSGTDDEVTGGPEGAFRGRSRSRSTSGEGAWKSEGRSGRTHSNRFSRRPSVSVSEARKSSKCSSNPKAVAAAGPWKDCRSILPEREQPTLPSAIGN